MSVSRYLYEGEAEAYLGGVPLCLEGFMVESLAYGLLQAFQVKGPPVPIRDMIRDPQWDPLESTCRHASLSIL